MAKINYTIKLSELEPFKEFYSRLESHLNDYHRDFCDATEAMHFITQDFICLREKIQGDEE